MYAKNEKIYFIDLFDGAILEGKFLEYDANGLWLKLYRQPLNKYLYADEEYSLVFKDEASARDNLAEIRSKIKQDLLAGNAFIDYICKKISLHEGSFHAGIIRDILEESVSCR